MEELIYNVQYIFQEYLGKHECEFFNIPEYQRGYKWTEDNVVQLLNDLRSFHKTNSDEFYCLQNITVTMTILHGKPCMNVIDGQQRLTTLFILLAFMQRNFADKVISIESDILKYSIRTATDDFLRTKVLSGKLWDEPIIPENADFKDMYYIMKVARAIQEWFANENNHLEESIVLKDLKLIVNEVNRGEEETVFASLNGGKVELDGADLVRAILITRAAKQKYPSIVTNDKIHQIANDDINLNINISVSSQGKINEYRVKLGVELDKMNLWWDNSDVQDFFEQLLPNRIAQNTSFRYNEYPIDLLYYAFFEANKGLFAQKKEERDLELRFFENGVDFNNKPGDEHLEFYNAVKEFHLTMVDWYNNKEIYNLVGYLMYNFKSNIITFELLWSVWKGANSKTKFKEKIKSIIRYQLAIAFDGEIEDTLEGRRSLLDKIIMGEQNDEIDEKLVKLRSCLLDTSNYNWYNNGFTMVFLPLFDILPYKLEVGRTIKYDFKRVNAKYLKRINAEDKEHVRSQTRNFDEQNMTEEDKIALEEENKHGLNSLGNIVLLHESVNRSYGNDKLILKMVRIYGEHIIDDASSYIRPHTLDVFMSKMKSLDKNGASDNDFFWSDEDIKRTVHTMDREMSSYFSFPEAIINIVEKEASNG